MEGRKEEEKKPNNYLKISLLTSFMKILKNQMWRLTRLKIADTVENL